MATQTPISTICYCEESFTEEVLQRLYKAHKIQDWQMIRHVAERKENGKEIKEHYHLRIVPNIRLDAMDISAELVQYVYGEEKPRRCMSWRNSKEEDWILYAVHDEDYLKQHDINGEQDGKLSYRWQDIKTGPDCMLEEMYLRAKASLERTTASTAKRLKQGESGTSLIMQGVNPLMINGILKAMQSDEIPELRKENMKLRLTLENIRAALSGIGFYLLIGEDGEVEIVEKNQITEQPKKHSLSMLEDADELPWL